MATLTSNASCNPSTISVKGKNTTTGTISWSTPSIPSGAIINSCTLTGKSSSFTTGNKGATLEINGTSVSSNSSFTIDLGTNTSTTSVNVSFAGGHNQTNTSVTLSNLVYTVDYTVPVYYTVKFVDWDGTVLSEQSILEGNSATAPSNPTREGYKFVGWNTSYTNVKSDLTITAQYEVLLYYTVKFVDWDGTVLSEQTVLEGTDAILPSDPVREGHRFLGWDKSHTNVLSNLTITAQYKEIIPSLFPAFTSEGWTLYAEAICTKMEDDSYGFTTESTAGWIGYYIQVPDSWHGNAIKINVESITDNASLVVQRADNYEEICVINSSNKEGIAEIVAGVQYTIFLRTNYLQSGEVLVTGVEASYAYELAHADSVELSVNTLEMLSGKTSTIKCTVTPSNVAYNLVWSVDNSSIVSFGYNGLYCNLLALNVGDCTLTVTDTVSGLSASCAITVLENTGANANVFPPFNAPNSWYLDLSCTLLDMQAYDCSFNAPTTWCGMSISIPNSWYGNTIELKCESISDNAGLYIQEADTWVELGILNSTNKTIQIEFPKKGTYSDIKPVWAILISTSSLPVFRAR